MRSALMFDDSSIHSARSMLSTAITVPMEKAVERLDPMLAKSLAQKGCEPVLFMARRRGNRWAPILREAYTSLGIFFTGTKKAQQGEQRSLLS